VFIFKTAGGPVPINFNASKKAIRNLTKKGYDVFYDRIIPIGSNWISGFRSDVVRQLYQIARHKVKISCDEMDEGKTRLMKAGFPLSIMIGVVAFLHDRLTWVLGKDYAVSSACNLCGKCLRNCPTGNIVVKNGKIRFKLSCLWCMRCIYGCPQNAIHHRLLSFTVLPSGYDVKKILESASAEEAGIGRTPPYLQNYIHNDQM
jgi:ferredoxin